MRALELEGAVMIPLADPEFRGKNCIDNERKTMCKTGPLKPEHQSGPSAVVLKLAGPPQLLVRSVTIYTPLPLFHQHKPIRRDLEVIHLFSCLKQCGYHTLQGFTRLSFTERATHSVKAVK